MARINVLQFQKDSRGLWPERHYLAPGVGSAPDASPEAFQLHNLAVIHKEVDINTKLTDVPTKDLGIRSLKHDTLRRKLLHDP